jgi:hypothetical protein
VKTRISATSALTASLALAACSDPASEGATEAAAQTGGVEVAAVDGWTVPRTSWGDPDLRGMWPLESLSGTPFQRPVELGEQALLTDEQYAERQAAQDARAEGYDSEEEAGKLGGGHWFEWNADPLRQTSLIVEPANGRVPPMTPEGLERAANMKSSWSEETFEWLGDFNALDRCITRGMPATMINFPYNNGLEIFQSPGYVVMRHEMIHETRIIPVDGRAPLPATFKHWLGESRGRWDGDTLVVETTNFNGEFPMVIVGPSNEPVPTSTSMRIVERLTPTGPDTIQYEATIEDPEVLTGPWTMAFPWTRDESYVSYEYACHEGNTVVPYYIRSTSPRFLDAASAGEGFDAENWLRTSGVTEGEGED